MKVYAIKELNSEYFVNKYNRLEPLGANSRFFKSRASAMRAIEYQDDLGYFRSDIKDDIAWHIIQDERKMDRWHIDMSWKEFKEYLDDIDLSVVEINVSESRKRRV